MLMLDEADIPTPVEHSAYEKVTDKVEWFICDYLQCFHVFIFCTCYNKNNNKSVAISQTATDIILHQSDVNIHPLHK